MRDLSCFLSSSLFDEHALSHSPILTPPLSLSLRFVLPRTLILSRTSLSLSCSAAMLYNSQSSESVRSSSHVQM